LREHQVSLCVLIGSSLLAIAWSFVSPRQALLAFVLNGFSQVVARLLFPEKNAKP